MTEKQGQLDLAYYCLREHPRRPHRLMVSPGRGGSIWWCGTHGPQFSMGYTTKGPSRHRKLPKKMLEALRAR